MQRDYCEKSDESQYFRGRIRSQTKKPTAIGELVCTNEVGMDGTSDGIRTRVAAVKGRCPRPLDHGGIKMAGELGFEPRQYESES
mgnify:CR=1 FL=1